MVVILNAGAGKAGKSGNLQSMIAELSGAAGLNAEIILVAGKDMSAAARQAVAENHETIGGAGGDGTVNTVAAEVAGTGKIPGGIPGRAVKHIGKSLDLPPLPRGA